MSSSQELQREAQSLSEYFLNTTATPLAVSLYTEASSAQPITLSKPEKKLWNMALDYPFLWPLIDAGLGLHGRKSAIRQKIFLFLGIAECVPEWADSFLPQKKSFLKTISFFLLYLFKSVLHSILGFFLVFLVLGSRKNR